MPSTSQVSTPSTVSTSTNEVHLLTLVHGMWGNPSHVGRLSEVMAEAYSKNSAVELNILIAETNKDAHTYDGVDWGAERVVEEIQERIKLLESDPTSPKKVTKFSILGYSLGGLVSRYAIGILNSQKFFQRVTPVNFSTVATPHIGLLHYPTSVNSIRQVLGPIFLSRTGKHFFATDTWSIDQPKPLLEVMTEKDGIFYQGLCKFKNITIYANAVNDLTVPFVTGAIETCDPFINYHKNGINIELDETYSPLIKSHSFPSTAPQPPQKPRIFSKAWFQKRAEAPPFLPPFLVRKFPLNVAIYASIPLLVPLLLIAVVTTFSINVVHSKRRIKHLESSGKGSRNALVEFFRSVERDVEDAVVEIMEAEGPDDEESSPRLPNPASQKSTQQSPDEFSDGTKLYPVSLPPWTDQVDKPSDQPVLTDAQKRMVANLNTIPQLKKQFAFIDNVRNSHATVICRDLKQFEFHRRGEGVLKHIADNFEM